MISYFDTSVIMAVLDEGQDFHLEALAAYRNAKTTGGVATTTLHTYAELYTNLTKMGGGRPGIPPTQANLTLKNLEKGFDLIEMNKADYLAAIDRCARLGLVRAVVYDALHLQAAIKAGANVLYTDNLKDFTRLITPEDKIKIMGVRTITK